CRAMQRWHRHGRDRPINRAPTENRQEPWARIRKTLHEALSTHDLPTKKPAPRGRHTMRGESRAQWNWSSSVEPVSAVTLDCPPWITVVTSSKYPVPTSCWCDTKV